MPRLITFYLPQYYPVPDNDKFWGKGFTEWTNTAKARRRFPGHYQPHVPADLGFYDLRVAETRQAQADLARQYGIEGFCYYHYWFGNGKRVLERPFAEVLASGEPDFPFCLCWANETWSGVWHGAENRVLIEQTYPGAEDDQRHFDSLLPAFNDRRYMKVDGKPIFVVYRPFKITDTKATIARWREMAARAGLPGIYFVGVCSADQPNPEDFGFDASIYNANAPLRAWGSWKNPVTLFKHAAYRRLGVPTIHDYEKSIKYFLPDALPATRYPSVINSWDNTPRSGVRGLVLTGATPQLYGKALKKAFDLTRDRAQGADARLVFLKSWNEWAEGNHLEPDLRDGHQYLEAIAIELKREKERLGQTTISDPVTQA
ncbi:glycoside hydrolase family 99-like domain-containing protein [Oxalobacteraceae sp. CFBP 13730]|nr:glycoside hydrolase family 99-like domain-containing protein [Oxalobacteraceae sp. CFBP 8763]MBD8657621.1 glycoside hydrolase family 99-like domain-containing protein [Oxalobacteraceae sp. CFBP 13730]RYE75279.1 MAG: lipopolysaccharide biosynthesis protein [Oxalobacteraceae bacterium]